MVHSAIIKKSIFKYKTCANFGKRNHLSTAYPFYNFGVAMIKDIQLKLINLAKERIFYTAKSVSQIAFELGFKYPQHFNRMFKKNTGFTPIEYRNLN
ncbi:DNA-binding transcriptional regulator ChbR [Flavobacterium sp. ACN6]|nr:DNA-binding transcriptional regulator ChbR [Flavobacterium sp. ACN6]